MSEAKNPLAFRYRKDENNNEYERDIVRFHEARKNDILIHPISGKPLIKKAIYSTKVTPHFAEKTSSINCKEQEIQTELNLKSPEDMSHDFAAGLIKKAFNDGLNIRIYPKACGKHYSELSINLMDLPYKNCAVKLEYNMSFQNSYIRWDIALIDEYGDLILGIEVLNTHETAEINRPSNIKWVEIHSKDIIDKLININDINDINESSYIDFNCQREFTNTDESKKCNACIEDEKRIQEEQETRRKEIERIKKIKEIREISLQNKIIHDNIEKERQKLEREKREEDNINRKIKENEESKILEIEREKIEEENIKRQKQWEEDEEKRKIILKEENIKRQKKWEEDEEKRKLIVKTTELKLKQYEQKLENIICHINVHKDAIYNIWKKINDNKKNKLETYELQKLKDDEQCLINFKIKNKQKQEKLLADIKQLKNTIEINKFPLIKPSLLYI
jgi:hypothetical protein